MLSRYDLEEMSKIEIENIPYNELKELTEIQINPNDEIEDRLNQFFDYIGNPYCFLIEGTPVQISFSNHNKTLNDSLFRYLSNKKIAENEML